MIKNLNEEKRFGIINRKKIPLSVINYLDGILKEIYITLENNSGYLLDLMKQEKLGGWCFQTTESSIIFFDDNDYIERGYLNFEKCKEKYYHSWICFKFDNMEYVFDPCLNIICKKIDYIKVFEIEVLSYVSSKIVKKEFIKQMKSSNSEVIVSGVEDVNKPLYRNNSGYKTIIEGNHIKKMNVYFYK